VVLTRETLVRRRAYCHGILPSLPGARRLGEPVRVVPGWFGFSLPGTADPHPPSYSCFSPSEFPLSGQYICLSNVKSVVLTHSPHISRATENNAHIEKPKKFFVFLKMSCTKDFHSISLRIYCITLSPQVLKILVLIVQQDLLKSRPLRQNMSHREYCTFLKAFNHNLPNIISKIFLFLLRGKFIDQFGKMFVKLI